MLKWIGAAMIMVGCGGTGFFMAASHRRQETELRHFMSSLDYMQCELQYRLTPLPDLCRQTAAQSSGLIRKLFTCLANELEDQIAPDVQHCMNAAVAKIPELQSTTASVAMEMGRTLGRFDLDGQIRGLEQTRQDCRTVLERLSENRDVRLRSYQTLGLCAGAALAILFI